MATIDIKKNLIRGKTVYYGPGLCGKTTNLEHVNRAVPNTDEMMSLSTEGDRTIFFDYLPMDLGKIRGISTNFKLYTVPGQVRYNLTRKMVLKNVDGVVFVADSQAPMMDANIESLQNLYDNLLELGIDPDDVPIVLQYNKRDLPNLLTREQLDDSLNHQQYPVYMASAVRGDGVMETLKAIMQIVFTKLTAEFGGKGKKDKKPDKKKDKKKDKKAEKIAEKKKVKQPKRQPATPPPVPADEKPAPYATTTARMAGPSAPAAGLTEKALERAVKDQNKVLAQLFEKNIDKAGLSFASSLEQKLAKVRKESEERFESFSSTTKKELDGMRKEIARLGKRLETTAKDGSAPADSGEATKRAVEQAIVGLPTKRDFRSLRKEIVALDERVQGAAAGSSDGKALDEQADRAVERAVGGLPSKRDFQVLRKEIALLDERVKGLAPGGGLGAKEVSAETRRAVEQATSGLATKRELDALRKEIAGLADRTAEWSASGGADQQALGELQRAVVEALQRLNAQTQSVQQAVTALGAELRDGVAKVAAQGAPQATKDEPEPEPEPKPEPEPEPKPEPEPEPKPEPEPEPPAPQPEPEGSPKPQAEAAEPKPEPEPEPEPASEEHQEKSDDLDNDPQHKNAKRIAKVMVSDLKLYYAADVDEGVKSGDVHERLKNQFEEMRNTYDARVPEEVRAKRDYLALAIDELLEKKRKEHGVE
jgi:signal recognition particle receptor subunit beta/outer membrane biosynthesis protein TonB